MMRADTERILQTECLSSLRKERQGVQHQHNSLVAKIGTASGPHSTADRQPPWIWMTSEQTRSAIVEEKSLAIKADRRAGSDSLFRELHRRIERRTRRLVRLSGNSDAPGL